MDGHSAFNGGVDGSRPSGGTREKQKLIISAAVSSKWLERRQASRRLWVRVPYCRGKIADAVKGSGSVAT